MQTQAQALGKTQKRPSKSVLESLANKGSEATVSEILHDGVLPADATTRSLAYDTTFLEEMKRDSDLVDAKRPVKKMKKLPHKPKVRRPMKTVRNMIDSMKLVIEVSKNSMYKKRHTRLRQSKSGMHLVSFRGRILICSYRLHLK